MLKRTKMTEQVVSERWKFWKKKVEKQELVERWQKDEKLERETVPDKQQQRFIWKNENKEHKTFPNATKSVSKKG